MVKSNEITVQVAGLPTGTLTLAVSPTAGNPLTYFSFSGTLKDNSGNPISGGQIVIYQKGLPYTDALTFMNTDSSGNYSTTLDAFADGTYSVYAAYVVGYGPGGSSNPEIAFTSPTVAFTVSAATLTCSPGTYQSYSEPDGSTYVTCVSGATSGGTTPYDFKFYWTDGVVDDVGDVATDTRHFLAGQAVEYPTGYVLTSGDGQSCSASITPG